MIVVLNKLRLYLIGKLKFHVFLIITIPYLSHASIDTIKVQADSFTLIRKQNGHCFYIKNKKVHDRCPEDLNVIIDKKILDKKEPYYLMTFYDKGLTKLKSEGRAIAHSRIGKYVEYYENGKVKQRGAFIPLGTGNDTLWNIENGEWSIYDTTGKSIRTEHWENGVFIGEKIWGYTEVWDIELFVNHKPNIGETIKVNELSSVDIKLKTKDHNRNFGRYECRLMLTGGKIPLKILMIDYNSLEFFNFQKFMMSFWKPGSNLFIEITDTNTGLYYNTLLSLE